MHECGENEISRGSDRPQPGNLNRVFGSACYRTLNVSGAAPPPTAAPLVPPPMAALEKGMRRVSDDTPSDAGSEVLLHLVSVLLRKKRVELSDHLQQGNGSANPRVLQPGGFHRLMLHFQRRRVPSCQPDAGVMAGRQERFAQRFQALRLGLAGSPATKGALATTSGTFDPSAAASTTAVTSFG